MNDQQLQLNDGRRLGYRTYGSPDSFPVLYYHGTPSSRKEPLLLQYYGIRLEEILHKHRIRLIAVDRPGMGSSDLNPAGDFISFAHDVEQLISHLSIKKCAVMAWSGGGPYALATGRFLDKNVRGIYILCGFTRTFDEEVIREMGMNKWYFQAAKNFPALLKVIMRYVGRKKLRFSVPRWITRLPPADYRYISTSEALNNLSEQSLQEACRVNASGAVHEARMYFKDFGFRSEDISIPVHFWWGTEDGTVTRIHAETIRSKLPGGKLHFREGEGHISLYIRYFEEVISCLSSLRNLGS